MTPPEVARIQEGDKTTKKEAVDAPGRVRRYVLWNRKIDDAVYGGNRKDREI